MSKIVMDRADSLGHMGDDNFNSRQYYYKEICTIILAYFLYETLDNIKLKLFLLKYVSSWIYRYKNLPC